MSTLSSAFQQHTLEQLLRRYPDLDTLAIETCASFFECVNHIYDAYGVLLSRYGLSTGRFTILAILFAHQDQRITPSDCADRAGVTRATMTGLLDGLERDGLILRELSQIDRRMFTIQLTPKSLELLKVVLPDYFQRTAILTNGFTQVERLIFTALITKIHCNIHALLDP